MKFSITSLVLFFFILPGNGMAQSTILEANALLDAEQLKFTEFSRKFNADEGIRNLLLRFGTITMDSLQQAFNARTAGSDADKIQSINSGRYFLQTLKANLDQQKFEIYDVPDAVQKFPLIADAIVNKASYREFTLGFGGRRTQLMADAFRQYPEEGKRLQYAADARRLAVNTDNILPLLERQPGFPFVDTALIYLAERAPMTLVDYLSAKNNRITDSILASGRPVIQQLVKLKGNRNASEIAPFAEEIARGRYTADEIQQLRTNNVKGYYQLLVNTIQSNRTSRLAGGPAGMQPALRTTLHNKAVSFYIQQINGLHESKDQVRFASIQSLRTIDLYYLIISGEEELYTSSFLGIYKRMMAQLPSGQSDSLMHLVQFDLFRKFIRICSHYNVLTDYLNQMPETARIALLKSFITGIESNTDTGLEDAMDVADAFVSLSVDPQYSATVEQLLKDNLARCQSDKQYYGARLYSILIDVFRMSNNPENQKTIFAKLGNYELLPVSSVRDKEGIINQLVIFYGDEDGKTSYQNFLSMFRNPKIWQVEKSAQWIVISSIDPKQPVKLYANLPLDHQDDLDEKAQLALLDYLKTNQIQTGVIIHRGHSYHLPTTLNYLQPYMKLAILGSCGGYKNILTVAEKSPAAQIVATKQVGSKLINDPMIQMVNEHFLQSKDIFWPEVWNTMGATFNKSAFTRDLFSEYVPPYRNLSLFVIRLFNYDESSF
ncbi:hypothetical protein [Flavihumibacter fluvii]|uniref:hypothetical protein n=1 Tax=Flavihumibacter fluvii TaxID=2838157 RepID=UPI001BDE8800|nr:hypothetical protein [Flavihumibacter fluvii]ULQ52245.1 hypothetical protein KJS93_19330 [Flavihumibacter fluvii]